LNFTQSIELFDIVTDLDEPFQHLDLQNKSILSLKSNRTIENHTHFFDAFANISQFERHHRRAQTRRRVQRAPTSASRRVVANAVFVVFAFNVDAKAIALPRDATRVNESSMTA
jgi:hypothetical protein